MTQPRNTLLQVLPWGLTALVTVVAVVGWIQYRGARKKLWDCAARPVAQEEVEPAAEPSGEPEPGPRALPARRTPEDGAGAADARGCLELPDVQKEIRKQANALAADLSLQQVEDYKKDEQGKRLQRRQQFMDNFETASANAVNAYAREAELDDTIS